MSPFENPARTQNAGMNGGQFNPATTAPCLSSPGETLQNALQQLANVREMATVIEDRIFGPGPKEAVSGGGNPAQPHLRQTANMLDAGLSDLLASLNRIAQALAL